MRKIERTAHFKRDYKREAKSRYRRTIDSDLVTIITALADDQSLAEKHLDHALSGKWKDCRDCHVKPDLVLIYRKIDENKLQLIRLGSHSELDF